jgi:hypothetical protein
MRTFSFIVAFGFVLVAPSLAGAPEGRLPGIGTFAYGGSAAPDAGSQPMMIATR